MSTGERSCVHFAVDCPEASDDRRICDLYCPSYEWDGKSKKDTE